MWFTKKIYKKNTLCLYIDSMYIKMQTEIYLVQHQKLKTISIWDDCFLFCLMSIGLFFTWLFTICFKLQDQKVSVVICNHFSIIIYYIYGIFISSKLKLNVIASIFLFYYQLLKNEKDVNVQHTYVWALWGFFFWKKKIFK